MVRTEYREEPSECPHPSSRMQKTGYIAGGFRNVCQECGLNFHMFGAHERVLAVSKFGDTVPKSLDEAEYECFDCGLSDEGVAAFQTSACQ